MIKMLFKLIFFLVVCGLLYVGGVIAFGYLTLHKPEEVSKINTENNANQRLSSTVKNELILMTWNIGYAGLGADMDFFYDKGKKVRPTPEWNQKYLTGITDYLNESSYADFLLLQEVDRDSKRSYNFDQFSHFKNQLKNFSAAFAFNYKVNFVPLPLTNPLGKTRSGLASFSKYFPKENTRIQFPGDFEFPNSLFFLKRCFLMQKFDAPNGKELVVINTHNSAYDKGGFLKKQQMEFLKKYLLEEYAKGNYVIVGGDWNQIPPDFNNLSFKKEQEEVTQIPLDFDYPAKGWSWVYDNTIASNRKTSKPYDRNYTFTTIIDFFLVSPNVTVEMVTGEDMDFAFSDHQPQFVKVKLN